MVLLKIQVNTKTTVDGETSVDYSSKLEMPPSADFDVYVDNGGLVISAINEVADRKKKTKRDISVEVDDLADVLAAMGMRYCCDFPNDEQPYRLHTPTGELYALPTMIEIGDTMGHYNRKLPLPRWVQMVTETVDVMLREAADTGLLLAFRLHP